MKKEKIIKYTKENYKLLFCYLLIFLGVFLALLVFIIKPIKQTSEYLFSQSEDFILTDIKFPLQEKINITNDKLTNLWIYLENESINNYSYKITVSNNQNKVYYDNIYNNYNSNIININLGLIEKSKNEILTLTIDCEECKNVKIATNSADRESYIVGNEDRTLKIYYNYYVRNNTFYWYSVMSIVLGLLLIPFSRGGE